MNTCGSMRAANLPASSQPLLAPSSGASSIALFDGDGHAVVHQQVVVGQKAREQHAVPVLVGHLLHQVLHLLLAIGRVGALRVTGVTELLAVGAQAVAQRLLGIAQERFGLVVADAQLIHGRVRSSLGHRAGRFDGLFQRAAQVFVECLHHGESGLSEG